MANIPPATAVVWPSNPIQSTLDAFPIACFTLTLVTDLAYMQTSNLLWLHFSEWLLFAGIVFGILAIFAHVAGDLIRGTRPPWLALLGGVVVLALAAINSFVHARDGWTAVVPYGLVLSAVTVCAMIGTAVLASGRVRSV
jgi:uncharacterized membrane protein